MKRFFIYIILILYTVISVRFNTNAENRYNAPGDDLIKDTKELLDIIFKYEFGDSRAWLNDFEDLLRQIHDRPEIYPEIEKLMIEFLQSDAAVLGKQYICKQLGIIGSEQSVPVLSKMLLIPSEYDMALMALEPIDDPTVDKVLIKALSKTKGEARVGIINSLGVRETPDAVKSLSKLIFDADPLISSSSISSLGKISTDQARKSLGSAYQKASPPLKWQIADSWLKTADEMLSKEQANPIYGQVFKDDPPVSIKTAALIGIINTCLCDPSDYLIPILKDGDQAMQEAVIPLIRNLEVGSNMEVFINELPNLADDLKIQMVLALADRRDPAARVLLLDMIRSENPNVRLPALMSFTDHATSADVVLLASLASKTRGREKEMARQCLNSMKGENIDDAILSVVKKACPEERVELIRSMGYRNVVSGIDILLISATHTDRKVRIESFRTLGKLGTPEYLPEVIQLMINSNSSAERNEAEKAVISIASAKNDQSTRSDEILEIIEDLENQNALISCINVLGNLGTDKSLPVLREYLVKDDENIRIAVIKALSIWPDASPREDLMTTLRNTKNIKEHTLALQGYIDLTLLDSDLSEDEKAGALGKAMEMTQNENEQKTVISGIANVQSLSALRLAVGLIDKKVLQSEVEMAILRISGRIGRVYPEETRIILNQLLNNSQNPEFKSGIKERLKWME